MMVCTADGREIYVEEVSLFLLMTLSCCAYNNIISNYNTSKIKKLTSLDKTCCFYNWLFCTFFSCIFLDLQGFQRALC